MKITTLIAYLICLASINGCQAAVKISAVELNNRLKSGKYQRDAFFWNYCGSDEQNHVFEYVDGRPLNRLLPPGNKYFKIEKQDLELCVYEFDIDSETIIRDVFESGHNPRRQSVYYGPSGQKWCGEGEERREEKGTVTND